MIRQLSDIEIVEAEALFLCIDWGVISEERSVNIMINMKKRSYEQYAYLEWLLLRWRLLRKDYKRVPAKLQLIVQLSSHDVILN